MLHESKNFELPLVGCLVDVLVLTVVVELLDPTKLVIKVVVLLLLCVVGALEISGAGVALELSGVGVTMKLSSVEVVLELFVTESVRDTFSVAVFDDVVAWQLYSFVSKKRTTKPTLQMKPAKL